MEVITMIRKIFSSRKGKAGLLAACAVAVLTLSVTSAFAASSAQTALKVKGGEIPAGAIMVKEGTVFGQQFQDGEELPTIYEDGEKVAPVKVKDGAFLKGAKRIKDDQVATNGLGGFAVKVEDGVTLYSIDGGKTWSETVPGGYIVDVQPDGTIRVNLK
jgi:hypothetical protein